MGVAPLLITGMHRSGTSATARLLQGAGIDVGTRLLPATLDNALGYYEDVDFYELNLALLTAGIGDDPRYQPDWAFPERLVPSRLERLRPQAVKLLAARDAIDHPWGFKDPRTTLLLDFYEELVPEARHVFVYRAPWDVLASLLNIKPRPLHGRADVAVRAWTSYNQRLLDFRASHPGRTVLAHIDAVSERPQALIGLVQATAYGDGVASLDAAAANGAFVPSLLNRTEMDSALAELLVADHPEAMSVYNRLEAEADLASSAAMPLGPSATVELDTASGALPVAAVIVGGEQATCRRPRTWHVLMGTRSRATPRTPESDGCQTSSSSCCLTGN